MLTINVDSAQLLDNCQLTKANADNEATHNALRNDLLRIR